jgi:WhiB family redox-sensing transcriptional regulator
MSLALAPVDPSVDVDTDLPCRRFDPDLWFSESPAELELAKSLCGDCPVRVECLAGAVERQEPWGVWGGEIFERGAVVPRKRPRGRPRKEDAARDEVLRMEVADRVAAQIRVAA